nr:MAG TPA: hypothetical protein [Caudoviricetes sp.]
MFYIIPFIKRRYNYIFYNAITDLKIDCGKFFKPN